jgi:DNA-binding MarR family transcriptional regulator
VKQNQSAGGSLLAYLVGYCLDEDNHLLPGFVPRGEIPSPAGLTREGLREQIDEALRIGELECHPDYEGRLVGAAGVLEEHYPEAAEENRKRLLAQPFYLGETEGQRKRRFIVRWRAAFYERAGLGDTCYAVGMALSMHAKPTTGVCWPSAGMLAERIGCHERTVRRALERLRGAGWVSWQARPRTSHRFRLTVPPLALLPDTESARPDRKSVRPDRESA